MQRRWATGAGVAVLCDIHNPVYSNAMAYRLQLLSPVGFYLEVALPHVHSMFVGHSDIAAIAQWPLKPPNINRYLYI